MLMINELMYKSGDLFERCVGMHTIYASEGRCAISYMKGEKPIYIKLISVR